MTVEKNVLKTIIFNITFWHSRECAQSYNFSIIKYNILEDYLKQKNKKWCSFLLDRNLWCFVFWRLLKQKRQSLWGWVFLLARWAFLINQLSFWVFVELKVETCCVQKAFGVNVNANGEIGGCFEFFKTRLTYKPKRTRN